MYLVSKKSINGKKIHRIFFSNFFMYDTKHIQENHMNRKNISIVKGCIQ